MVFTEVHGGITMKTILISVMMFFTLSSSGFAQTLEERIKLLEEALKKQEETIKVQQKLIEDLKVEMKQAKPPEQPVVAQPKETPPAAGAGDSKNIHPRKSEGGPSPEGGRTEKGYSVLSSGWSHPAAYRCLSRCPYFRGNIDRNGPPVAVSCREVAMIRGNGVLPFRTSNFPSWERSIPI